MKNAIKAYDIRGVYDEDFNLEDAYRIGYYLPQLLKTNKVLLGRDCRESSPAIYEALSEGLIHAGADVHYTGLATTPMIYYLTAKHDYLASVQITASHNPKEYNGMKVSGRYALPIGKENGLAALEQLARTPPKPGHIRGKIIDIDLKAEYLGFLHRHLPEHDLRLAIDTSNGMAGLLIEDVLGSRPAYLNLPLDGTFPNHEANPLDKSNLQQLIKEVVQNNKDLGVIFDGDADRVAFTDETGLPISPDLMIAMLGHHFLEKEKGEVVVDIRTSRSVVEYLNHLGARVHMWKVGRAFASPKLKEINGIFGGELAGHYYFRDFYYSDSGILALLFLLEVFQKMKARGKRVSDCIRQINRYHNSGELNFVVENKTEAINALCRHFLAGENPLGIMDFDGYRYDFSDWWFNVRTSNTEPYLRLVIEAAQQATLQEKTEQAVKVLQAFLA